MHDNFGKMKSLDFFCSSPACTAICSNNTAILGRHIDHGKIKNRTSSQFPVHHHHLLLNHRKSTSSSSNSSAKKFINDQILRRKSSADVDDLRLAPTSSSSSSYLSSEKRPFLDVIPVAEDHHRPSQFSNKLLLLTKDNNNNKYKYYKRLNSDTTSLSTPNSYQSPLYKNAAASAKKDSSNASNLSVAKTSSATANNLQVVELRVSIHCKGCEGKLRKHISKMEGVKWFSIDLPTKKVTIIGDVSAVDVLTSISKVKNAQFWSTPRARSALQYDQ